jgi:hypothetical protein
MRKRLAGAVAAALFSASAASAQAPPADAPSIVLCVGEKSAGFSWKHNAWKYTRFKPGKYIVERVTPGAKPTAESLICAFGSQERDRIETQEGIIDKACYNLRDFDAPPSPVGSQMCTEHWRKTGGALVLDTVACNAITFDPSGSFHAALWQGASLDAKAKRKDAMKITVGRCSIVK